MLLTQEEAQRLGEILARPGMDDLYRQIKIVGKRIREGREKSGDFETYNELCGLHPELMAWAGTEMSASAMSSAAASARV